MKIIVSILAALLLASFASAAEVSLAWDPPDSGTPMAYRVYQKTTADPYPSKPIWEGAELTCKANEIPGVEYAYVATAVYEGGITGKTEESGYSNEVTHISMNGTEPKKLIIQSIQQIIGGLNGILEALGAGGA